MPWGPAEKKDWFKAQQIQRSYKDDVLSRIENLKEKFEVIQYGALPVDSERYPLYLLKDKKIDSTKETVLITGGVHGYETSGVHGVLDFFEKSINQYSDRFQFIGVPCVSPWAYETINRWNPNAIDPNRSFVTESPSEECEFFIEAMSALKVTPLAHFDLHETTDTDNSVFRPALESRDGIEQELTEIPDGFYVVGDTENSQPDFQRAIIDSVRLVTHIAPADGNGKIIGENIEQEGVVNYPVKSISLCAGFSDAKYVTTTEVYPDSPKVTPILCVAAQLAAIEGGLRYLSK